MEKFDLTNVFFSIPIFSIKINTLIIIQLFIWIILLVLFYWIIRLLKVVRIEDRIGPYVIRPLNSNEISLFEKVEILYQKIISKMSNFLKKSVICTKYSKRLDKYKVITPLHKSGMDILSGKIIIALSLTLISIFIKALGFRIMSSLEMLLVFTFGFFVFDIYLFLKYKVFRYHLESDFISAITIMNNAFKSGRNITQAIDIASNEVKGQIGREFKRMQLELLYGLSIDMVFKRFAERIELEEARYLTASLTILNKTGGNIIKVFSVIERSLFDKRKLRLELSSLTSGSKIIIYVLLGLPFFFVLVISLISSDYFLPFISTDLGRILLIFMMIYYIIFVVVVRKIMKVVV